MSELGSQLAAIGVVYTEPSPGQFVVSLPGTAKQKTVAQLMVGERRIRIVAFVCRAAAENHAELYAYLLRRNARAYPVAFALDPKGDIYLVGSVERAGLTTAVVDSTLGAVASIADETFNDLLRLGFAEAIKREWAWRTERGESLANLEAFRSWVA